MFFRVSCIENSNIHQHDSCDTCRNTPVIRSHGGRPVGTNVAGAFCIRYIERRGSSKYQDTVRGGDGGGNDTIHRNLKLNLKKTRKYINSETVAYISRSKEYYWQARVCRCLQKILNINVGAERHVIFQTFLRKWYP